jgi:Ca-activated chloride channel homolog
MTFAWPLALPLLAVPGALFALEIARSNRAGASGRPKILRAEAGMKDVELVESGPQPPSRRRLWLCAGLTLAIVALARPQWGRVDEPVFDQSREVIVAVDLSRSMLTPDVTPNRLERTRLLIQSLLDWLAGERVGLVVFSGTAFLQCPLSADYEILREFLPSLGPDFLPVGGTNYGAMIDAAADAFSQGGEADRYLIVLSDGGATDEDWRSHLGRLTEKGVRVISLGVGTAKGGFIPDTGGGFMKDERGAVVLAKLESDTLQELARKTGGVYRDASEWVNLPALLKSTVEAGKKGHFVEKNTVRLTERFQWALAPALCCLIASFWLEFPVRPKPRVVALRDGRTRPVAGTAVAALLLAAFLPGLSAVSRAATAEAASPPGDLLGHIVGRLSAADTPTALDWAELGRETLTWGRRLQSQRQAVQPGPVNDALEAVRRGSALNPKATDWTQLRSDLEALLRKPPEQKEQKEQKNQDQQQQQDRQQQQQSEKQKQNRQEQQPGQSRDESTKPADDEARSRQRDMQRVGGSRANKTRDPAAADPELAVPVQKLDQVRSQDSPAELYQMIENTEAKPATQPSRNW